MFDNDKPRTRIGKDWKPPATFKPEAFFKKKEKKPFPHISLVEPPNGSMRERIVLHINESLEDKEKRHFSELMHDAHPEIFGCACWGPEKLRVRISLKTADPELLTNGRMDLAKWVNDALDTVLKSRDIK